MESKYYVVDYGKDMVELAELVMANLKEKGHHKIVYLTDFPESLYVTEVSEDEFLMHFAVGHSEN